MSLEGACDAHVHVYDGSYPTSPTTVLRPPDAGTAEYRKVRDELGLDRVVFVQPTTYGLDNRCQLAAAQQFGDAARTVVVVGEDTPTAEIDRLHQLGARGVRFHMLPGGAVPWEAMGPVAGRIEPFGWHVQLQLNGRELPQHLTELRQLPTPLVIDHVGRFMPPVAVADDAFAALLTLVEDGRCWVKLSAPYESDPAGGPDHPAVTTLVDELVRRAPERMLWASNWPHPGRRDPPTTDEVARLRDRWLPSNGLRRQVLVVNPATVYGFPAAVPTPAPTLEQESA